MSFGNVFVTVGTTQFDKLVSTVLDGNTLQALTLRGCYHITIQLGRGEVKPEIKDDHEISLKYYRFQDSIEEDIEDADLVISHAGAGTCLDVLEKKKPLITVINDDLMHNHQTELADKFSEDGYCVSCTCSTLAEAIKEIDPDKLKRYFNYNDVKCASLIEKFIFNEKIS